MNQSKLATGRRLLAGIAVLSVSAIAAFAFAIYAGSSVSQAAPGNGPAFNALAKKFEIKTDQGTVGNVASSNGRWEKDFFRIGSEWNRQGDFPGGGNRIEVCDDNAAFALWGYVHNTRPVSLNHKNEGALDFRGPAVARNTTVTITSPDLDKNSFANKHEITLTVAADNAATRTDTVEVYCDKHAIKIVSGSAVPKIRSWSAESVNKVRHDRAAEVFGADYSITDPEKIFTDGSRIGYAGHLPACRYYAAYLEVELKVVVGSVPAPTGSIGPETGPQTEVRPAIPRLGFGQSDGLNYGLVALIAGSTVALILTQRAAVARARRKR